MDDLRLPAEAGDPRRHCQAANARRREGAGGEVEHASIQYEGYLVAAVERWKEYVEQLRPLNKKPVLFVMLATREMPTTLAIGCAASIPTS